MKYGIFICRAQPFHNAHAITVKLALERVDRLIIVIGSSNQARTVKNPFTAAERKLMILTSLTVDEASRIDFIEARDYLYNDNLWITALQEEVNAIVEENDEVTMFGHNKDDSSFYLKLFPQWGFVETGVHSNLDATTIRELYFRHDMIGIKHLVPQGVYDVLYKFQNSTEFKLLHEDFHHLLNYRKAWEGAPFPPTFVTTDAVVIGSGHVLVVRRKGSPGKGLLALPGGFLNQGERIVDGAIRELREETRIKMAVVDLRDIIVDEKVFDHPGRSLRGRTITHAFCFNLNLKNRTGGLPQVKGADDAEKAFWLPLHAVSSRENEFFEDHAHIINFFVNRF